MRASHGMNTVDEYDVFRRVFLLSKTCRLLGTGCRSKRGSFGHEVK